jgi:predicted nuclease with TOPRIM domain
LKRLQRQILLAAAFLTLAATLVVHAQGFTKAVVGDHIKKVEDGVDEFRDYLEKRGETAKNNSQAATQTEARRGRANTTNTEARKEQARQTKDDLEEAMDDLNGATNRLRRRFDGTDKYMETKSQMENVMESARRVNQVMVKGNYGTQPERLWAPLRNYINDLARTYGLSPMAK